MSAAATAAGYLYASGRLRGKNKEGEAPHEQDKAHPRRKTIRVAALPEPSDLPVQRPQPAKPVRVAYRTRRWKPE